MKLCTKWTDLPRPIRDHLRKRLLCRKITSGDLNKLRFWIESQPDVPEDDWFKDFGSFKIVGRGAYPLTFFDADQVPYGTEITTEKKEADD